MLPGGSRSEGRRAAERARLARYDAATLLAAEDARDEVLRDERVSA